MKNPVAKAVRSPRFRVRVVPSGRGRGSFQRQPKHRKPDDHKV
jgi:stalled ribosome alternative rescue factor ArfA